MGPELQTVHVRRGFDMEALGEFPRCQTYDIQQVEFAAVGLEHEGTVQILVENETPVDPEPQHHLPMLPVQTCSRALQALEDVDQSMQLGMPVPCDSTGLEHSEKELHLEVH